MQYVQNLHILPTVRIYTPIKRVDTFCVVLWRLKPPLRDFVTEKRQLWINPDTLTLRP